MTELTFDLGCGVLAFFEVEQETEKAYKLARVEASVKSKLSFWVPKSALKEKKESHLLDLAKPELGRVEFTSYTLKPWFAKRLDSYQRKAFDGGFC